MSARGWRIGEILEAPAIDELQSLAENHLECTVTVFDGQAGGRATLRLTVTKVELHPSDAGVTWPAAIVHYERAKSADLTQLKRYPLRYVAEQVHNYEGRFDHGTMNAL